MIRVIVVDEETGARFEISGSSVIVLAREGEDENMISIGGAEEADVAWEMVTNAADAIERDEPVSDFFVTILH